MAYILDDSLGGIGDVKASLLTQAQHQTLYGPGWELCASQSLPVTAALAIVAGYTALPDARGVALRGKNNGGSQNPDGDLALGQFQGDTFASHTHSLTIGFRHADGNNFEVDTFTSPDGNNNPATTAAGGNETRMKNITVNFFARIS